MQVTLFVVILLALWIPRFVSPVSPITSVNDGPLFQLLSNNLRYFPAFSITLALILVLVQSVFVFSLFESNSFFGRRNFMPAIIALLALSWNFNYQTLHALLPGGIFVLIALNSLMFAYGRQAAYHQVFTASFSIGVASLFYFPLAYLLLMVLVHFDNLPCFLMAGVCCFTDWFFIAFPLLYKLAFLERQFYKWA